MGTERNGGGGVAAGSGVPATAEKVVRSVKEIVNCTEEEIYAALTECDMDVNRAVDKLLSQDTFHEVRSKRDRRKEGASNSKIRSNTVGSSRGGKTGTGSDSRVVQSGLTYETYNEHEKAIDKGEDGSVCSSVMPPTTHVVRKTTKSGYFSTDNGRQSLITNHPLSDSAQTSSGPWPSMTGVSKGRISMADIVRMGRTSSQDAVSDDLFNSSGVVACENSESSLGLPCQNHSEQQVLHDEWPIIEQPIARNSQTLKTSASSSANGPSEHPSMTLTPTCLPENSELDAAPVSWGNVSGDDSVSASISSKHIILSSDSGLQSHSHSNLRSTLSPDLCSSHEQHEDVSSAATIFWQLSIGESKQKLPTFEDDPEVIIPTHLQALGAECSHLSFGTYNGSSSSASSVILTSKHLSKSGMEEKSAAVDNSSTQFLDASSVYQVDKQLGFDVLGGAGGDKNSDFLSSPKQWLVSRSVPEETFEHQHNFTASVSDPSLQNSHWVNTSLPFKQSGLQSGNQIIFPTELYADSNSVPDDVLAFLMTQSQPARHSNAVSSINNPAISMSKVMEPGAFSLPMRSAISQDPTVHSSTHFRQLPDTNGYLSLPKNKPFLRTIDFQQAFSGHTAYNPTPADMNYNLPHSRKEFLTNRLAPATARDVFGYGNVGSSIYSTGGFLSNPSLGRLMPSSNFNDVLPSEYNGGHNGSSIQQHGGSFSHWDYEAEPRSSLISQRTQHNFLGQPNQASLLQYASPGYSNLYHSQTRVLEELQQPGGFQDLSSEQLHQFWKHSH